MSAFLETLTESTTFWVAVSFCIFWIAAFRPILKAINSWLDGKIVAVRRDIDAAAALRAEAEQLLADATKRHETSAREAEDMVSIAKAEAQMIAVRAEKDLATALAQREAQAMERIARAEKQAMADLQQLTTSIAIEATRSLLTSSLTDADRAKLADQAIADIGTKAA